MVLLPWNYSEKIQYFLPNHSNIGFIWQSIISLFSSLNLKFVCIAHQITEDKQFETPFVGFARKVLFEEMAYFGWAHLLIYGLSLFHCNAWKVCVEMFSIISLSLWSLSWWGWFTGKWFSLLLKCRNLSNFLKFVYRHCVFDSAETKLCGPVGSCAGIVVYRHKYEDEDT